MKGSAGNVSIHLKEIDILKALLIICIVIGHCITIPYINVFWFHVPAFFILAGYFISEPETNPLINKKEWTKKIMRYVVPYFAYSISFYLIFRQEPVVKNLVRMLYAGYNNISLYSYPFWFINALFISNILFLCLLYWTKSSQDKKTEALRLIICFLLYIIIHIPTIYPFKFILPWSVDQSLGAIIFIYVGYCLKNTTLQRYIIVFPIFTLLFVVLHAFYPEIDYNLNMCQMSYPDLVLDLLVPLSFTITLYYLSLGLKYIPYISKILCLIGASSFTIFFTHASVIALWPWQKSFLLVLCCVVVGCLLHYIFNIYRVTKGYCSK